jgi:hypothetical protein
MNYSLVEMTNFHTQYMKLFYLIINNLFLTICHLKVKKDE